MPVVINELGKLGILEDIKRNAYINHAGPVWRKADGTELAALGPPRSEITPTAETPAVLIMGQHELAHIVLDHIRRCNSITVKFSTPCVGVETLEGKVRVMIQNDKEDCVIDADWAVGADGCNSAVRQMSLIPFEGFSWSNYRFTAADVRYDFEKEGGYREANFIVDPINWAIIARTGRSDVWRVAYGEKFDTPVDDRSVRERAKTRISRFLPRAKDFELVRVKPYVAHQRCAAEFIKGRVVLIGDAAHVSTLLSLL